MSEKKSLKDVELREKSFEELHDLLDELRQRHRNSAYPTAMLQRHTQLSLFQLQPFNKGNSDNPRVGFAHHSTTIHDSNTSGSHGLSKKGGG